MDLTCFWCCWCTCSWLWVTGKLSAGFSLFCSSCWFKNAPLTEKLPEPPAETNNELCNYTVIVCGWLRVCVFIYAAHVCMSVKVCVYLCIRSWFCSEVETESISYSCVFSPVQKTQNSKARHMMHSHSIPSIYMSVQLMNRHICRNNETSSATLKTLLR